MIIALLRLSYWSAAIADFGIAALILVPVRMGAEELEYPMALAATIVFFWGVLLLFADRRPLERRWVLVPTAMVVASLTLVRTIFVLKGAVASSLGILVLGVALAVLLSFSYYVAERFAESDEADHERV